jgi:hypothetical protein
MFSKSRTICSGNLWANHPRRTAERSGAYCCSVRSCAGRPIHPLCLYIEPSIHMETTPLRALRSYKPFLFFIFVPFFALYTFCERYLAFLLRLHYFPVIPAFLWRFILSVIHFKSQWKRYHNARQSLQSYKLRPKNSITIAHQRSSFANIERPPNSTIEVFQTTSRCLAMPTKSQPLPLHSPPAPCPSAAQTPPSWIRAATATSTPSPHTLHQDRARMQNRTMAASSSALPTLPIWSRAAC